MITPEINIILQEIAKDVMALARSIMDSSVGINTKVNKNTLKNSELYNDIQYQIDLNDNPMINMLFNHYLEYIELGRPPEYGKWPPINVIINWMQRKHIAPRNGTIKQVAFLIARAIWRDGYDARPVLANLIEKAEKEWDDKWADRLFQGIIKELEEYFKD